MGIRLQSSVFWLLVLIGHAIAAAAWWWLMPGGFAVSQPRFWVNQVLPVVVIAAAGVALWMARSENLAAARTVLFGIAGTWFALALVSRAVFPISTRGLFIVPLAGGVVVVIAAFGETLRVARTRRLNIGLASIIGCAIGAAIPFTERAPLPSTHPIDCALPAETLLALDVAPGTQSLRGFDVNPNSALVTPQRGRYSAYLLPLLTFRSRSPDRCWVCFAPPAERMGPRRLLSGYAPIDGGFRFGYDDEGRSILSVRDGPDGSAEIEAIAQLPRAVYSHLNTFCEMEFAGHHQLFVAFSPCPEARIEVTNSDYPVGRPARFAYVDAERRFHVVEAHSGEKGPYHALAEGKLANEDVLAITLYDKEEPIARLTLADFAAQCSTAVSPTAGWRVPSNAIEFTRDSQDPASPASFFVTLAGTSVGRGFDSVGHAAGTYRNRMKFEWID